MKLSYTNFGKTADVEVELHNMKEGEEPEEFLWVERTEDYYAIMSPQLRNKRVAIVTRRAWLRAVDKEDLL